MLIRQTLQQFRFSPAEQVIVQFILEYPERLEKLSIQEIAGQTYSQPSAIVRVSKKLGYHGWKEFKKEYLEEWRYLNQNFTAMDANLPFSASDNIMTIAGKLAQLEQASIDDILSLLHHDQLNQAKYLLLQASHIKIFALSANQLIAQDFALKMNRIQKTVSLSSMAGEEKHEANNLDTSACAIIISYSGETPRLLEINRILRDRGIPTIGISSIGNNQLSKECSCFLPISTREKLYSKIGNFSINISIIYLLDVLYSIIFAHRYEDNLQHLKEVGRLVDNRKTETDIIKEQ